MHTQSFRRTLVTTLCILGCLLLFTVLLGLCALPTAFAAGPRPAEAPVIYVKADAMGTNDGTSWTNAYTDLSIALSNTLSGELWVAAGTYTPTLRTDPADAHSVTFVITNGVALYGGFAGGETARNERDWTTHIVTLSGDIGVVGDPSDYLYYVVTCIGAANSPVLDGLTIADGGMGMYIVDSNPTVAHCIFRNNGGGGMSTLAASPVLTDCTFISNQARNGGGIYIGGGNPTLDHCTFRENAAEIGGGIYNTGSPRLTNCVFWGNHASEHYDRTRWGGGMYETGASILTNCIFGANTADDGGGMYSYWGTPQLTDCVFVGNLTWGQFMGDGGNKTWGAGFRSDLGQPTLTNCTFNGNRGYTYGIGYHESALGGHGGDLTLRNSILWGDSWGYSQFGAFSVAYTLASGGCPSGATCDQVWDGDPLFVNAAAGVPAEARDLRLRRGSPAIDVGNDAYVPVDVTADAGGAPRIIGRAVDLGAYEANLGVTLAKAVAPSVPLPAGAPLTYTLTVGNTSLVTATDVLLTDIIPPYVLPLTYDASGIAVTPTGAVSYTWQVGDLAPAAHGVLTVTGVITPGLVGRVTFTNTASITSTMPSADMAGNDVSVQTQAYDRGHVYYVKSAAAGAANGSSWTDAFRDLQPALSAALYGDEIWVAEGTYVPTLRTDPANPGSATFVITSGVALYGGFAGGETARDQRDWVTHPVTLTGEHGVRGASSDYSFHVVTTSDADPNAILDGFTVTGSRGSVSYPPPQERGGGIYNEGGSPTLANCILLNNDAEIGGGMYTTGGSPRLTHCTFAGNLGGGMYTERDSPILTDCRFVGNHYSSGMHSVGGSPTLTNCTFEANSSYFDGGGFAAVGGHPVLNRCRFVGNTARGGGGGVSGPVELINCAFLGNASNGDGGGANGASPLTNCTFQGNTAGGRGGALYALAGTSVRNSILWDNGAEPMVCDSGAISVTYSLVQGGCPSGAICDHLLDADPLFLDPGSGDLRLHWGSPAIDSGNDTYVQGVTTDLAGNARIQGAHVDLGAYEATPGVGIVKAASPSLLASGDPLTYTLACVNTTLVTATGIVITDIIPPYLSRITVHASGVTLTPTGSLSYTWRVSDMAPTFRATITLTGVLSLSLRAGFTFTNTASIGSATGAFIPANAVSGVGVTVLNTPPAGVNDSYSVRQNSVLTVAAPGVLANDQDLNGDVLSVTVVSAPLNGVLALRANGGFVYTPTAHYVGTDRFSYRAFDGQTYSSVATATVQVLSNWPPARFYLPLLWRSAFGSSPAAGGWTSQEVYPRTVGDVNGDGKADVVGFGALGAYVSLSTGAGLGAMTRWSTSFGAGPAAGSWISQTQYPRMLGDVNGDHKADAVGFGGTGVFVALAVPTGTLPLANSFGPMGQWSTSFGSLPAAGGWTSQDRYPRLLGDVNGDGKADVVGFGAAGVYVALSTGRAFAPPRPWSSSFGALPTAGGWTSQNVYPRLVGDVNGDGKADVVGLGAAGTYVALSTGSGLGSMHTWSANWGASPAAGGWTSQELYPRTLADVNGDGKMDIVGYGVEGTYYTLSLGNAFGPLTQGLQAYGSVPSAGGWSSQNQYPRLAGPLSSDHKADLVGFGSSGVWVAPGK